MPPRSCQRQLGAMDACPTRVAQGNIWFVVAPAAHICSSKAAPGEEP